MSYLKQINHFRLSCFCWLLFGVLLTTCQSKTGQKTMEKDPWKALVHIRKQIKAPKFANKDFNIKDFGAVGDGKTKNTEAIKNAIQACTQAGGGRVVVPPGVYLTGAIHLKSNVNLHVAE